MQPTQRCAHALGKHKETLRIPASSNTIRVNFTRRLNRRGARNTMKPWAVATPRARPAATARPHWMQGHQQRRHGSVQHWAFGYLHHTQRNECMLMCVFVRLFVLYPRSADFRRRTRLLHNTQHSTAAHIFGAVETNSRNDVFDRRKSANTQTRPMEGREREAQQKQQKQLHYSTNTTEHTAVLSSLIWHCLWI